MQNIFSYSCDLLVSGSFKPETVGSDESEPRDFPAPRDEEMHQIHQACGQEASQGRCNLLPKSLEDIYWGTLKKWERPNWGEHFEAFLFLGVNTHTHMIFVERFLFSPSRRYNEFSSYSTTFSTIFQGPKMSCPTRTGARRSTNMWWSGCKLAGE